MLKFYAAVAFCLLFALHVKAQSSPVPTGYVLKEKADYARYSMEVISTTDWLQQTPWQEQPELHQQAQNFLIDWLSGSPDVLVIISPTVKKLYQKNKELLITYLSAYAKYALQHKSNFSKYDADAAAVQAIIAKYQNQPDHIKDHYLDKLVTIQEQGQLDKWMTTQFYRTRAR